MGEGRGHQPIPTGEAKTLWAAGVDAAPEFTTEPVHLVTGTILPIWDRIAGHPRIYRAQTDVAGEHGPAGERMIGRAVMPEHLTATLKALGASGDRVEITPDTLAGLVLKAALLLRSGKAARSWHRTGLRDMFPLVGLVAVVFAVGSGVALVGSGVVIVPRSVPFIEAMLAVLGLAGLRFAARVYYEERGVIPRRLGGDGDRSRRVVVAGAGDAGTLVAREMLRHPKGARRPVAFVDDDPAKASTSRVGVRVLGTVDDLGRVVEDTEADEVLIAMPSADGREVRRVVEAARAAGVEHRIMPGLYDLASGRVTASAIREVDVEDLLRRSPVRLDPGPLAHYLGGRTVLVTGAGGSIGSEIVRQVAAVGPEKIVLLGRGENSVYGIDRELAQTRPDLDRHAEICDVRDRQALERVFRRHRPDVVFHAAAHKHVPLMEANPCEAIRNNVVGTRNVAELAAAERLVNISTDKAVNPTNVMGASKRVAEMVVAATGAETGAETACRMVSVRFGNVLGSRGSVVPLFREQIARGGPVTVTHPDMVRYFMTIPEASQLVLQAGAAAEPGRLYVLDMGDPVRIVDLARDLVLLSGFEPGIDIDIEFTGVRPGEKLYEEILLAEEGTEPGPHEKVFVARRSGLCADFDALLDALTGAARDGDGDAVRAHLRMLVPTYQPEAALPTGSGRVGQQVVVDGVTV